MILIILVNDYTLYTINIKNQEVMGNNEADISYFRNGFLYDIFYKENSLFGSFLKILTTKLLYNSMSKPYLFSLSN